MRRSLPIAIILIAAGIALWAGKNGELNRFIRLLQRPSDSALSEPQIVSAADTKHFNASASVDLDQKTAEPFPRSDLDVGAKTRPGTVPPVTDVQKFLRTVSGQLRDSLPFKTELQAQLNWNGTTLSIPGQYAQLGQGKNQFRIDLRISAGDSTQVLSKRCDGRFLYSMKWQGGRKTLEFVDLRRIQEARTAAGLSQADNPTNWLAAGGLASLLDNLSTAFQFDSPQVVVHDSVDYLRLDGIWNSKALVELLKDTVPSHYLEPNIAWRKLPPHIPHQVSLFFAQSPSFGWMPVQLGFYRFVERSLPSSRSLLSDSDELELLAKIRFSNAQPINVEGVDFLQLDTEDTETIDNTPQYISQLRQYKMHREAKANDLESGSKLR
jgi:hypothetical protein